MTEQAMNRTAVGAARRWKKLLLWLVLLLQVCVIGTFWLLHMSSYDTPLPTDEQQTGPLALPVHQADRVNFIRKITPKKSTVLTKTKKQLKHQPNVNVFFKDFMQFSSVAGDNTTKFPWCFRQGTEALRDDVVMTQCQCLPEWHGSDCGQPEVIWRALMTARQPLPLLKQPARTPLRLLYLLEGNFLNLELLQLQIEVVQPVVDFYVIYLTNTNAKRSQLKQLQRRLSEVFGAKSRNYALLHCALNCTTSWAYVQLRQLPLFATMTRDLCVHSDDHTLLSEQALKFLKYYASGELLPLLRLRLKHNVYGFYWQHPQLTQLGAQITACAQLDVNTSQTPAFILGDLNHFGGWYCAFCQQPDEIIAELLQTALSSSPLLFSNASRGQHIDAVYLQQLIAQGIYVDGQTQLLKLRRYADKYYAPPIALANKAGSFSNLLANLYESFEDDLMESED